MDSLEQQIKQKIVEVLELKIKPEAIGDTVPLFGKEGLGLDSVDALEIAAMLELEFEVVVPDREVVNKVFASVSTLADYVRSQRS